MKRLLAICLALCFLTAAMPASGTAAAAADVTVTLLDPAGRGTMTLSDGAGNVLSSGVTRARASVPAGETVTASAAPNAGYLFDGWHAGSADGKLLSSEEAYTFSAAGETIVPVYKEMNTQRRNEANRFRITYHANGGRVAASGGEVTVQDVKNGVYLLPNCLIENGTFVREGYRLVEYNTKPDGTGDAYSPGSKLLLPAGVREATLYCVWLPLSPESDFTCIEKNGALTVKRYLGDDETVVVPDTIGGRPVRVIGAGAFKSRAMKTLSLPTGLTSIEPKAFQNCKSLETVYFPDTIVAVPELAIIKTAFPHLYIYAATAPRYSPGVARKFEAVAATREQNRVIVLSGSSSLNGLDSKQLAALLDGEYYVVNYGTNASGSAAMYMEMLAALVHEGDVVVQAPEDASCQIGSPAVTWRHYRETESFYNIFRLMDATHFTNLFAAWTEHQDIRMKMSKTTYTAAPGMYDEHGDRATVADRSNPKYHGGATIQFNPASLTDAFAQNLNRCHALLEAAGAKVAVSFAPHNANALSDYGRTTGRAEYARRFAEALDAPVISRVEDYTLAGEYMFDSDWHPNDTGRAMRTAQLARDLLSWLNP